MGIEIWLVVAVVVVGVLHTAVPDHWLPIALLARQRGWTRRQTAKVAAQAGLGHVVTTLVLGAVVWVAGASAAQHFGRVVDIVASIALVGFGLWIAIASWRELQSGEFDAEALRDAMAGRSALLLILGSSPMVEGIPAFFAASRYGVGLLVLMAILFAASTIATYVVLSVSSASGLRRVNLGPFERYGEIISGLFIAVVGIAFGLVSV